MIKEGELEIEYLSTNEMPAYLLTKVNRQVTPRIRFISMEPSPRI